MPHSLFARCASTAFLFAIALAFLPGCGPKDAGTATNGKSPDKPPEPKVQIKVRTSGADEADLPATPRLIVRDKRDWSLQETAARSLGRIGEAAVPDLTRQLTDSDPLIRKRAADVLARIGPQAEKAVPDLVEALEDEDEAVRKSAALALGQIGPGAADAVPALVRVMNETVAKAPEDEGTLQR
jgi:uncharacterized UBP type Zn finger protein